VTAFSFHSSSARWLDSLSRTALQCLFCDAEALWEFDDFPNVRRVTSDCRPFPPGGRLLVCKSCSVVQKRPDDGWLSDIAQIYSSYDMYHQSAGTEQSVLDPASNRFVRRSEIIVRHLQSRHLLGTGAKVLDIGCGTGVTLEALSKTSIGLRLFGLEHDARNLPRLLRIGGFEDLFLGSIDEVPADFDLVTLVHSLEHFSNPAAAVASAASRLVSDGSLFIQVVDSPENPFDLVIADHMAHFSAAALCGLALRQNLNVMSLETSVIRREISLIAKRNAGGNKGCSAEPPSCDGAMFAARNLGWLSTVLEEVEYAASKHRNLGLFGSSIAATWLAGTLGERVKFFVDEDPARVGRYHLGRPILAPQDVPADAGVYVGMAPVSAESILERYANSAIRLIGPPKISPA
jgi:SAM-dependent methyltransferase